MTLLCRPVITELHVQKALNLTKRKTPNSLEYNKAMSRALRLIQMKNDQPQLMAEAKEIESILGTLLEDKK